MTPDEWQLRDAWLAEMWGVCRERPREERDVERALAEGYQQPVDERRKT